MRLHPTISALIAEIDGVLAGADRVGALIGRPQQGRAIAYGFSRSEPSRAAWFSGRCEASFSGRCEASFPETALSASPHHEGLSFRSGKSPHPEDGCGKISRHGSIFICDRPALPRGHLAQWAIDIVTLGFCLLFSMVAAIAIIAALFILLFVRW
jgi:hypothetical protein